MKRDDSYHSSEGFKPGQLIKSKSSSDHIYSHNV